MKLFWTPASPFVRKVVVAAIELGLRDRIEIHPTYWPHEWGSRTVDFDKDFVAANPVGRIPALITDDGVALTESNWICDHLDRLNGSPRLLPPDGIERSRCIRILGIADGALEAMIARRAELLRRGKNQSDDFLSKQQDRIVRCFDAIERETSVLEEDISLAQITTGIACSYMDFRYPDDHWRRDYPKLVRWYDEFAKRPSMIQTLPAETPERGLVEPA